MYVNKAAINATAQANGSSTNWSATGGSYWSSSEYNTVDAWLQDFDSGQSVHSWKAWPSGHVRAVPAF